GAVVADLDDDSPTSGARGNRNGRFRGLAGSRPLLRQLTAVVDRVDDEVLESIRDAVEDLLVQLDVFAHQDQLRLFAGLRSDVADDARKTRNDAANRHHCEA